MIVHITIKRVKTLESRCEFFYKEFMDSYFQHFVLSKFFTISGVNFTVNGSEFNTSKMRLEVYVDTVTDQWIDMDVFSKTLAEEGWKRE